MATYLELRDQFRSNSDLQEKVEVACTIWAKDVFAEVTPDTKQVTVANLCLRNTGHMRDIVLKYVLADNQAASVAAIEGASDAVIQAKVDAGLVVMSADLSAAGTPLEQM